MEWLQEGKCQMANMPCPRHNAGICIIQQPSSDQAIVNILRLNRGVALGNTAIDKVPPRSYLNSGSPRAAAGPLQQGFS
jgi:hypothetical protein